MGLKQFRTDLRRVVGLHQILAGNVITFSGFSVGFCINEEEGYLLPTTARKITLPTFRLNAPVVIRAKKNKNIYTSGIELFHKHRC